MLDLGNWLRRKVLQVSSKGRTSAKIPDGIIEIEPRALKITEITEHESPLTIGDSRWVELDQLVEIVKGGREGASQMQK